jgi:hypothetical protein
LKLKAEYIVELIENGKVVYSHKAESKSFVKNLGIVLAGMLREVSSVSVTNTAGGTASVETISDHPGYFQYDYTTMYMNAGDNDDSFGIIVGSGSTPVSPSDYALASKISHGTSPGQLDYDTHTVTTSYTDTSSYVEIARTFMNKSGGDVVVSEVGLVVWAYNKPVYVTTDVKYLIARDLLPNPITVKNFGTLNVKYRISLAVT